MIFWRFIFTMICAIPCVVLVGCGIDTYEVTDKGYTWRYKGLIDDTTMVVEVRHWESGVIHCSHFMNYDDGETFSNIISIILQAYVPKRLARKTQYLKIFCRRSCLSRDFLAGPKAALLWILSMETSIA